MRNTNVFMMSLLAGTLFLGACSKEDDKDTTPPVINWVKPINASYAVGDTVFIHVSISDDVEMHHVDVHIYKKPTMEEAFHLDRHSHSNPVNIETYYVIPAGGEGEYEIEIHAEDDAKNESESKRDFTVNS